MKTLKIIALSFLGLLVVLAIGTYIFVNRAFTPDPNYLELSAASDFVPIHWSKSEHSDIAGLLLPVQLEGIPRTFYLQFDTGATSTLLYKETLLAIQEKYPNQISAIDSTSETINQSFQLGDMRVHSDQFKLYSEGQKVTLNDSTDYRIGTLGADIIDRKITVMDFKNNAVYFGDTVPDLGYAIEFHDLIFKKRRVLIPATVAGRKANLLHDTGTSGFSLITNKKTWKKLATKGATPKEAFKVKSWKRTLSAFNIASDKQVKFPTADINLNSVTYVEGASFLQSATMRMTGLGGLIGNQLFQGNILILDCNNRKYAILEGAKL